ncbi:hypothetical protein [Lentzea sp. NEAU-D7]|uniref:hypothetical protein n=1 Tax=Lentzea sp. NEAU-D7 TaxID=2994667 RepID=UPI00224A6F99|nr:hypothetical protein [Lentzea sp. NEAU-D7]MCX2948929.1 hypothetical protein [Lentzea sp. NEAU-D7]
MSDQTRVRRIVEVIMGTVVGLTFLFGFGNVLSLGLRLGVQGWIAPLVAPAVDLSVVGLLLGLRHTAANGVGEEQLKPVRRLLMFCSLVTLALNIADPVIAGEYGKAAFDAVGPLLLIGWSDVGPRLLQGMNCARRVSSEVENQPAPLPVKARVSDSTELVDTVSTADDELLERARREDIRHRELYQRPISSEALRQRLRVGSAWSRRLVNAVRSMDRTGRATVTSSV